MAHTLLPRQTIVQILLGRSQAATNKLHGHAKSAKGQKIRRMDLDAKGDSVHRTHARGSYSPDTFRCPLGHGRRADTAHGTLFAMDVTKCHNPSVPTITNQSRRRGEKAECTVAFGEAYQGHLPGNPAKGRWGTRCAGSEWIVQSSRPREFRAQLLAETATAEQVEVSYRNLPM